MNATKLKQHPTKSRFFEQTVELLLELHRLMSNGQGESEEADAVRDRMDYPWYQLNQEEVQLARRLSADLYTIDPTEPSRHPLERSTLSEETRTAILSCLDDSNWEELLRLLDERAEEIASDEAAYYRGRCWCELGFDGVGLEFLEFAAKHDVAFHPPLILPFIRLGRFDEAKRTCEQLIQRLADIPSYGQFMIANACCILADRAADTEKEVWLRKAVCVFSHAFQSGEEVPSLSGNYLALALCHLLLGNLPEAHRACEEALKSDPENAEALLLHGHLLSASSANAALPSASSQDFIKSLSVTAARQAQADASFLPYLLEAA